MSSPPVNVPIPNPHARVTLSAVSAAFTLLMQQTGAWVVVTLVLLVVTFALMALGFTPLILLSGGFENFTNEAVRPLTLTWFLQYVVFLPMSAWTASAVFNVGFKQIRGGYVKPDDLFSVAPVLLRVMGFMALLTLAVLPVTAVNEYVGLLFSLVLNGRLFLTTPLIVDRNLGLREAAELSARATRGQWLNAVVLLIASGLAAAAGILLLCVGIIVTLPLAYLPQVVVYRRFFPDDAPSTISPDLTDADFRTF